MKLNQKANCTGTDCIPNGREAPAGGHRLQIGASGGRQRGINPTTISREGGQPNTRRENDPNPPDNLYDYYLFFGTEEIGTVELCLFRNVMNTYYSFLRQLLLVKIRNEEFDPMYSLINIIDMVGKWSFTDEPNRKYFHEGHFNYGIKIHYVAEPDYPIQLD